MYRGWRRTLLLLVNDRDGRVPPLICLPICYWVEPNRWKLGDDGDSSETPHPRIVNQAGGILCERTEYLSGLPQPPLLVEKVVSSVHGLYR
jgi:hypothetical protein